MIVENLVNDYIMLKKIEADDNLSKLQKFSQKNEAISDNLKIISQKNIEIEKATSEIEREIDNLRDTLT